MSRFGTGWWRRSKTPGFGNAITDGGGGYLGGVFPPSFDWTPDGQRRSIAFYGDSISLGAYAGGTTEPFWTANGYVAQLRATLQARHGDGGVGFISLGRGEWVKTGAWTQLGDYAPFGQCWYATNDATKLWTLTVSEGDNIDIFYLNGGGYGAFDVVVDGTTTTTITPSGSADSSTKRANISLGSSGAHTVVVKAPASGTLYFVGAAVYKGSTGLVLHNISRSGAVVNDLAYMVDKKLGVLAHLAPRLNIVGYVTNDFSAQTTLVNYQTRLNTLLSHVKTYGDVMCWVPPDNGLVRAIPVQDYEAIAKSVAVSNGGFWLDAHQAWGAYAANLPKMYDTVHPNLAGHTAIHDLFIPAFERIGA